ncbi:putative BTBD8, BACK domain-containing protein [Helianthus anomalus]
MRSLFMSVQLTKQTKHFVRVRSFIKLPAERFTNCSLNVMEQLVDRLDVAMFNAILRESAEEMPTDPLSDLIGDLRVLPIPAGKSSFGAGA